MTAPTAATTAEGGATGLRQRRWRRRRGCGVGRFGAAVRRGVSGAAGRRGADSGELEWRLRCKGGAFRCGGAAGR